MTFASAFVNCRLYAADFMCAACLNLGALQQFPNIYLISLLKTKLALTATRHSVQFFLRKKANTCNTSCFSERCVCWIC